MYQISRSTPPGSQSTAHHKCTAKMKLIFLFGVILSLSGGSLCLKNDICAQEPAKNGNETDCTPAAPAQVFTYYLDTNECKTFEYLGCGANENHFPRELYCMMLCKLQ